MDEREKSLLAAVKLSKEQNDDSLVQKLNKLADFYRDQKQIEKLVAVVEERHGLRVQEGNGPSCDLVYLANDLAEMGDVNRALALLERANAEYDSQNVSEDAFERETLRGTRVHILLSNNRFEEAIPHLRLAVVSASKFKSEYSDYWESHCQLADLLQFHTKDVAGALVEREKLNAFFSDFISKNGTLTFHAFSVYFNNTLGLGTLYRQLDQRDKASRLYIELAGQVERSPFLGPDRLEVPSLLILAAEVESQRGEKKASQELAAKGLELLKKFKHEEESLVSRATALLA